MSRNLYFKLPLLSHLHIPRSGPCSPARVLLLADQHRVRLLGLLHYLADQVQLLLRQSLVA